MREKTLYTINFKNRYTREKKTYIDCTSESRSGLRLMFDCPDGSTVFFDLGRCLIQWRMDSSRTKLSQDTYYYTLDIIVLTDDDIELILDTLGNQ